MVLIKNEEGIWLDEREEVYHSDALYEVPSASASLLKILADKTPMHMRAASPRLNPKFIAKNTDRFDRGKLAHAWTLSSGAKVEEIDADDWRTKAAKDAREVAQAAGKIPALSADCREIEAMIAAQREQLEALECGNPFIDGHPEVVLRWLEIFNWKGKTYRVWCRCRMDYLRFDLDNGFDYKSSQASAKPEEWSRRTAWQIGAPLQSCHYRAGLRRLAQLGKLDLNDPDFVFIVNESEAPYALSAITFPDTARQYPSAPTAIEIWREALVTWQDCLDAQAWPGYQTGIFIAEGAKPSRPENSNVDAAAMAKAREEWEMNSGGHVDSESIARGLG